MNTLRLFSRSGRRFLLPCALLLCAAQAFAQPKESLSVTLFGADGGGKADNTAAFQKALDTCGAQGGGAVTVPAGVYLFEGVLKIPANVALKGTFVSAPSGTMADVRAGKLGSALLVRAGVGKADGPAFIELAGPNAAVEGFAFAYPDWNPQTVPPVPYPPTVAVMAHGKGAVDNVLVANCLFLNSYEAIHFVNAGRHLIRNVTGYPIRRGIYIDDIWDVGRIENVHFWPFGHRYSTTDPYSQWINQHGVAIEVGFSDWQIISNCFSFGYGTGYLFSSSPQPGKGFGRGSCGKMIGCGADCSFAPIRFEKTYSHWLISDSEFVGRWGEAGTTAVELGPDVRGRIQFTNCAFWGPVSRVALMRAPQGILGMSDCQIETWDDTVGAVQIDAGRAVITGNSFAREGVRHLLVGGQAGPVVATGNLAWPGFDIRLPEGGNADLIAANNERDKLVLNDAQLRHYVIEVGMPGDSRYLDNWHDQDLVNGKIFRRWSRGDSLLRLPVAKGAAYEISLKVNVPEKALDKDAGVYLGTQRLAAIDKAGAQTLRFALPAALTQHSPVELRVVTAGWRPDNVNRRTFGLSLENIEVAAEGSGDTTPFDAGRGDGSQWVPPPKSPR